MATTFYPRLGLSAPAGITLPGVWKGGWSFTNTTLGKALSLTQGTSQVSASGSSTSNSFGLGQFCSPPLLAQTIASGSWTVGFALSASPSFSNGGGVYVAVMKGDGSGVRGVIISTNAYSVNNIIGSEVTRWSASIFGSTVVCLDGDYLLVELGFNNTTTATINLYCDGGTAITADNVATSDAQSVVTAPANIVLLSDTTTLWLRLGLAAPAGLTLPSGYFQTYTASNASFGGANTKLLGPVIGASQTSSSITQTSTNTYGLAQLASAPLAAGTYPASALRIGIASSLPGITTGQFGRLSLYLINGSTGAIRTTLCSLSQVSGGVNATTEKTLFTTGITTAGFTATVGDYLLAEIGLFNAGSGTATGSLWCDGATQVVGDFVVTSDAGSNIVINVPLVFQPITVSGTATLGAGSGLSAAGVAHTLAQIGVGNLGSGSNLAAAGVTARVSISGSSSLGSGAGLTAAGVKTLVVKAGTATLGAGAGLTAAGVATVVHISGSATLGAGGSLAGIGTFHPGSANATATLGVGAGLTGAGTLAVVSVSGTATLGSGAGLSGVGTFQSGTVAGAASLGSGAGLSGVGVINPAGTAGLSGGSGLFAAGLPFPAITVAVATLGSGSGVNAAGIARPATTSSVSSFGTGGGLSAQGAGTIPTIFGTASLGSGSGLSAAGVAHTPSQVGAASLGAGGSLAAQGVLHVLAVSGVSSFGAGSGLAAAGVPALVVQSQPATFGAGSGLTAPGTLHGLIVVGVATLGVGGGLTARGVGLHRGAASFGAGANLSAMGGELSPPSGTLVTASVVITNLVTGSAIIVGIMSGSVTSLLDEEEDIDTTG